MRIRFKKADLLPAAAIVIGVVWLIVRNRRRPERGHRFQESGHRGAIGRDDDQIETADPLLDTTDLSGDRHVGMGCGRRQHVNGVRLHLARQRRHLRRMPVSQRLVGVEIAVPFGMVRPNPPC